MLGFSKSELALLKALTKNPQSTAALARKVEAPRMTVYTTLLRLEKEKLVKRVDTSTGKRFMWVRNDESYIEKELHKTKKLLVGDSLALHNATRFSGLTFYRGKKEISRVMFELTKRTSNARLYSIQNSANWRSWVSFLGKDLTNAHNRLVVDSRVVSFSLHSPTAPKELAEDEEIIKAYKGRIGGSRAIPESFLKKDISFYIFEDTIFLVNLAKAEAFTFKHNDFSSFLIKMFMFMYEKSDEEEFFIKHGR